MKIHRHANYKDPVKLNDIHGEFAYKNYMEIRGTEIFGKYIVIVSDDDLGIEYNVPIALTFDKNAFGKRLIGTGTFKGVRVNPVVIRQEDASMCVYEVER